MTEILDGQLCFLESQETERLRRWHELRDTAAWTEISATEVRKLPDGAEVIVVEPGRDYKTGAPRQERNRYFRVIVEHVELRWANDIHLMAERTDEWPEIPPWQSGRDGKQWVYPDARCMYFVRRPAP